MKNEKKNVRRSTSTGKHLDINGKTKKTTAKHLKKISKSNSAVKHGLLCSTCNQFLKSSHYSAQQKDLTETERSCNKCIDKLNKKRSNKEIVLYIYQKMGVVSEPLIKNHLAILHETKERRKNKGDFRETILDRDHHQCLYCHEYGNTVDHLIPISKGGYTTPENCVCSCTFCNHIKSDIEADTFIKGLSLFSNEEWLALKNHWTNGQ